MADISDTQVENKPKEQPGVITRLKESLNFRKMSRSQAIYTILFLAIVGLMIFLYIWTYLGEFTAGKYGDRTLLTRIIILLFVIPVLSIGWLGIPLYFGIMFLQCIVAPIPSELVQVVGGLLFQFWLGSLLSLTGIMITSFIGYSIAIKGGAHVIAAAIGEKNVGALERFIGKYGIWAMIIGRGIPFVPFDLLTYGAGLVKMDKRDFVVGTLIGTIPRSLFYAWVGSILFPGGVDEIMVAWNLGTLDFEAKLEEVAGPFNLILTLTIVLVAGGFAVVQFIIMPIMRKKATKAGKVPPSVTIVDERKEQPTEVPQATRQDEGKT